MTTAMTEYGSQFLARKSFSMLGQEFRFFTPEGELRFLVKQKAFKLKEEITVFADEGMTRPVITIKARSYLDLSATYDITDAATGETIGAMKRKGARSILRDEWSILAVGDQELGTVQEDSMFMALLRRFLSNLIPQTFQVRIGGEEVGVLKQKFNPFRLAYDVDFSKDTSGRLDRRMGIAMTVLLLAIEGRQKA